MEDRVIRFTRVLGPLALLALLVALWKIYGAPRELTQGLAQKIFYVHVPNAIPAYLGFALAGFGGAMFLGTRREVWDRLALAGAEVGVVFCTLLLVTGPIWARPIWGVWWDWGDLRLATTAVLWFIYVGYLFLRSMAVGDFARNAAAVLAIVGLIMIPFVHYAVRLAQGTIHPDSPEMSPEIRSTFLVSMAAFTIIFAFFVSLRLAVARAEADAEDRELEEETGFIEGAGEEPA